MNIIPNGTEEKMYNVNQLTLFDLGEVDYNKLLNPLQDQIRLKIIYIKKFLKNHYLDFWELGDIYDSQYDDDDDVSDNYDETKIDIFVEDSTSDIFCEYDESEAYDELYDYIYDMVYGEITTKTVYESDVYEYKN